MQTPKPPGEFASWLQPMPMGPSQEPDTDCCADPTCTRRPYNQATVLVLERLSQAYAAMQLLSWHSANLWQCDEKGHTKDCPTPECTFGREQAEQIREAERAFCAVVRRWFAVLTNPAMDLTAEWHAFYEIEQATAGMRGMGTRPSIAEQYTEIKGWYDVWRDEATKDLEPYDDWLALGGSLE